MKTEFEVTDIFARHAYRNYQKLFYKHLQTKWTHKCCNKTQYRYKNQHYTAFFFL